MAEFIVVDIVVAVDIVVDAVGMGFAIAVVDIAVTGVDIVIVSGISAPYSCCIDIDIDELVLNMRKGTMSIRIGIVIGMKWCRPQRFRRHSC